MCDAEGGSAGRIVKLRCGRQGSRCLGTENRIGKSGKEATDPRRQGFTLRRFNEQELFLSSGNKPSIVTSVLIGLLGP